MRRIILSIAVCTLAASALPAQADPFSATLSGFEEIGALNNATGAILTDGEGSLRLNLDERNQTLDYTLTYSDLTSNVTQAHLHFGKIHVAGGVFVFLCSNLGNGPAGTPARGTPAAPCTMSSGAPWPPRLSSTVSPAASISSSVGTIIAAMELPLFR